VIVAIVWSHDTAVHYAVVGMFGAMSTAFIAWQVTLIPSLSLSLASFAEHGFPFRLHDAFRIGRAASIRCVLE
jgi:hypothetical protein